MCCRHFILIALLGAVSLSGRAQSIIRFTYPKTDHDWTVKYGTNKCGLEQATMYAAGYNNSPEEKEYTYTSIHLGSHSWTYRTTVWPILLAIAACLVPFIWLLVYGIGSLTRPAKKPPPPNPSPPP